MLYRRPSWRLWMGSALLLAQAGCGGGEAGQGDPVTVGAARTADAFIDVTATAFSPQPMIAGWPGLAAFDYDNDGDIDIFIGSLRELPSLLYENDGRGQFTFVPGAGGLLLADESIVATGVGDFDNDGWLDLILSSQPPFLAGFEAPSQLLLMRNLGAEVDGMVRFADVTAGSNLEGVDFGVSIGVGDIDRDGLLDIYVGRYNLEDLSFELGSYLPDTPNVLLRNTGVVDGRPVFEDITAAAGVAGTRVAGLAPDTADIVNHVPTYAVYFSDVNEDGWLDLFSLQEIPGGVDLFINNRDGTFRLAQQELLNRHGGWMGVAAADHDRDGHLDYFLANVGADAKGPGDPTNIANAWKLENGTPFHRLLRGAGAAALSDVAADVMVQAGTFPPSNIVGGNGLAGYEFGFGCAWLDVQNDGWPDLHWTGDIPLSGLIPDGPLRRDFHGVGRFLANNGDGRFVDRTAERGLFNWRDDQPLAFGYSRPGRALAAIDLNGDGFQDVCHTNAFLFPRLEEAFGCRMNPARESGHWLIVRLNGTLSNRFGIGARVEARAGNDIFVGEVVTTTSAFTAVHPQVHFGLGAHNRIDELTVQWPSGLRSSTMNVAVDRIVQLSESDAASETPPQTPE